MKAKQDIAGTVIARLTGNEEPRTIIPGVRIWVRPSKVPCQYPHCWYPGKEIIKGQTEIAVISSTKYQNIGYYHYHIDCFRDALLKEVEFGRK
jgi:hypothetical protein